MTEVGIRFVNGRSIRFDFGSINFINLENESFFFSSVNIFARFRNHGFLPFRKQKSFPGFAIRKLGLKLRN